MEDTPQNTESSSAEEQPQQSRVQRLAKLGEDAGIPAAEFGLMVAEYAGTLLIHAHDQNESGEPAYINMEDGKGPFRLMAGRPDPSSIVLQDAEGNEIKPN